MRHVEWNMPCLTRAFCPIFAQLRLLPVLMTNENYAGNKKSIGIYRLCFTGRFEGHLTPSSADRATRKTVATEL